MGEHTPPANSADITLRETAGTTLEEPPQFDEGDDVREQGYVIVASYRPPKSSGMADGAVEVNVYNTKNLSARKYLALKESDHTVLRRVTDRGLVELVLEEGVEAVKEQIRDSFLLNGKKKYSCSRCLERFLTQHSLYQHDCQADQEAESDEQEGDGQ